MTRCCSFEVSKTAPTGEYLTPGSFMIRGKKNYLSPVQLQMGFGFLFRLDEDSLDRHRGERSRFVESTANEVEDLQEDVPVELSDEDDGVVQDDVTSDAGADGGEFPDVTVPLENLSLTTADDEGTVLQLGPTRPPKLQPHFELRQQQEMEERSMTERAQRRQQKKQKKAKQKYRDQDEEERELRMELLGSAGAPKPDRKSSKKNQKQKIGKNAAAPLKRPIAVLDDSTVFEESGLGKNSEPKPEAVSSKPEIEKQEEEDDAEEVQEIESELSATLDSLTAVPVEEDTLLFAVPVCAPYSVMINYKFKTKLTPGTGKRGKATKTSLQMFVRDSAATQRERELLKAVQEDMARNLPGKAKVSAPQLLALKRNAKR